MTEPESAVRCNRCGLWKNLREIARVLLSDGICISCSEERDSQSTLGPEDSAAARRA
jgi:hypothetical protein